MTYLPDQLFKVDACPKHSNRWRLNGICRDCQSEPKLPEAMLTAGQRALDKHLVGLVSGIDYGLVVTAVYEAMSAASGMEAPSGGETGNTGSTEGDSPTAESGDAQ